MAGLLITTEALIAEASQARRAAAGGGGGGHWAALGGMGDHGLLSPFVSPRRETVARTAPGETWGPFCFPDCILVR